MAYEVMNKDIRPKSYYDVEGTKLVPTFNEINNLISGITSGVSAGTLNLLSGLTADASALNAVGVCNYNVDGGNSNSVYGGISAIDCGGA